MRASEDRWTGLFREHRDILLSELIGKKLF